MYKGAQVLFPKPYRKINAPHHPGRAHCLFALFAGLLFQHMGDGFKVDRLGDIAAHARIVALFAVGGKGVGRHGKDGHIVVGTVTGADTAGGLPRLVRGQHGGALGVVRLGKGDADDKGETAPLAAAISLSLPHPLRGSRLSERAFYAILPNLRNPSLQRPLFGLYYYYVVLCQPDKTEG